ncbi:FecR family protein [Pedobacter frigoris]|uniref:FecR family protein n=1 Tax=Pedobacter frigoris TaxID=2571272 RepID=UPI00292D8DE1|nr:FecR domain-containing protein [Pedobacter frigoris]
MNENQRLKFLFERQLSMQNSAEEKNELLTLMSDPVNEELVKILLNNYWEKFEEVASESDGIFQPGQGEEMLNKLLQEHIYPSRKPQRKLELWMKIGLTAAIAVILFGVSLFYFSHKKELSAASDNIAPGKTGATLTLADGRRIRLSDAVNGELANEAGVSIVKSKDGQLIYEVKGASESNRLNTLSTTNGETYQVRLPDGSMVWLNSASSISYTASLLEKGKRIVRLQGEGYFEISKDASHPFIVKTSDQDVEVLGTHFNINAYEDEPFVKTTLLEGSVKVNKPDAYKRILKPGEQSASHGNGISVETVNAEYAVAWKDGFFRFNNKTLDMGLREIARWYNVQVTYKRPELKNEQLGGRISKYATINQVLKKMELAGVFRFKVNGREVIVE